MGAFEPANLERFAALALIPSTTASGPSRDFSG